LPMAGAVARRVNRLARRQTEARRQRVDQEAARFVTHVGDCPPLTIERREFMARAPSGSTVTVYGNAGSDHVIDSLLVTSFELKPPKNGSTQRRQSQDLQTQGSGLTAKAFESAPRAGYSMGREIN